MAVLTSEGGDDDEPLTPMSLAKVRGEHYTVKDLKTGYACLHCGLGGDIRWIRSQKCTPSPAKDSASHAETGATTWTPSPYDEVAQAKALRELEAEEFELTQMLKLQQLQVEEALLSSLMLEQQALELALKASKQTVIDLPKADIERKPSKEILATPERNPQEIPVTTGVHSKRNPQKIPVTTCVTPTIKPAIPVDLSNLPYGAPASLIGHVVFMMHNDFPHVLLCNL